jgi:16S rRNA (uracil1498-N3)-methyltransferase
MPKPPRFFITPKAVRGPQIIMTGDDLRHIRTVLRKQPGDLLILLDGKGKEYTARIVRMERTEIIAEVVSEITREAPHPIITLCQGLPKADKMDWIVQKATELGVSAVVPLITERTIVKIKDEEKRVSRWQKIAREAAMQSNRVDIPAIGRIASFKDFLRTQDPEPGTLLLLPWEEGTVPIKDILRETSGIKKIIVLIGPEGGFSEAEAGAARGKGFHLVSLGPNILRTETAAIAVLGMIMYEFL